MQGLMRRFVRDSKGATAVEYGLIVSLVVIAIIGSLVVFGGNVVGMWNNVATVVVNS